jgi:hypothetical protein
MFLPQPELSSTRKRPQTDAGCPKRALTGIGLNSLTGIGLDMYCTRRCVKPNARCINGETCYRKTTKKDRKQLIPLAQYFTAVIFMVDPITLQTISVVFAAVSLSIGAAYNIINIRNTYRTRQAQLFMDLYRNWAGREMSKLYGRTRYGKNRENHLEAFLQTRVNPKDLESGLADVDTYSDYQTLANFFEGIGVLVRRRLINLDLVEDLFSQRIIWWWEAFRPISYLAGKGTCPHPNTEWLYNESIKRRDLLGPAKEQSRTVS